MTSDLAPPKELQRGLSSPEAAARLARDGGNTLPVRHPTPLWRRVITQLRDPLVLVLLAAAVFTIATQDFTDTSVILFVITVNTIVGVVQEVKAERAITALASLTAPDARVIRALGGGCPLPAPCWRLEAAPSVFSTSARSIVGRHRRSSTRPSHRTSSI